MTDFTDILTDCRESLTEEIRERQEIILLMEKALHALDQLIIVCDEAPEEIPQFIEKTAAEVRKIQGYSDHPAGEKPSVPTPAPRRPAGIPSNFVMTSTILAENGAMTSNEIVDRIQRRWWPLMTRSTLGPSISDWIKSGRMVRRDDGMLVLTPAGRREAGLSDGDQPVDRKPVPPKAQAAPRQDRATFLHGDKTAELHPREHRIVVQLRAAMGKGFLDAKFLIDKVIEGQRAPGISPENMIVDMVQVINPKIAPLGLVVEHHKNYGFVMKEVPA